MTDNFWESYDLFTFTMQNNGLSGHTIDMRWYSFSAEKRKALSQEWIEELKRQIELAEQYLPCGCASECSCEEYEV